ncbi:MAG: hypothetical protein ACQEVA_19480 [Myxococcota bacterium]
MGLINYPFERREKRSKQTYQAINFQLEHIFENHHLESFVLGDNNGLVLASAGEDIDASVLAAFAPVLHKHRGEASRESVLSKVASMMPEADLDTLRIRPFMIDGEMLFLCSLGERSMRGEAGLYRAVTGIRRIMRQTSEAA